LSSRGLLCKPPSGIAFFTLAHLQAAQSVDRRSDFKTPGTRVVSGVATGAVEGVEFIEAPVVEEFVEFVEYVAKRAMAIDQARCRKVDSGRDGPGLAHVHELLDSTQIDFFAAEFDAIERTRSDRNLFAATGSVNAAPHRNSLRDLAQAIHGLFLA
jgi:hypothetical protein